MTRQQTKWLNAGLAKLKAAIATTGELIKRC